MIVIFLLLLSYWPEMDEIVRVGDLVIGCQMTHDLGPFVHRDFILTDEQSGEMRIISHVQYLEWPDHGAPALASQFLDYVRYIQKLESSFDNHQETIVLVHCSAGIGRTGAFILLDSAMHLINAGYPVNPIQLIKMMRDQRPMMLQTSVSVGHFLSSTIKMIESLNHFSFIIKS